MILIDIRSTNASAVEFIVYRLKLIIILSGTTPPTTTPVSRISCLSSGTLVSTLLHRCFARRHGFSAFNPIGSTDRPVS